jgi:hypothetical protein
MLLGILFIVIGVVLLLGVRTFYELAVIFAYFGAQGERASGNLGCLPVILGFGSFCAYLMATTMAFFEGFQRIFL